MAERTAKVGLAGQLNLGHSLSALGLHSAIRLLCSLLDIGTEACRAASVWSLCPNQRSKAGVKAGTWLVAVSRLANYDRAVHLPAQHRAVVVQQQTGPLSGQLQSSHTTGLVGHGRQEASESWARGQRPGALRRWHCHCMEVLKATARFWKRQAVLSDGVESRCAGKPEACVVTGSLGDR